MSDTVGSLNRRARLSAPLVACFVLLLAAGARAQEPTQPTVTTAPAEPDFMTRYDFHLNAAGLITSLPATDQRFSWDTHFGGSLDLVDFVAGRAGVLLDYEAVLGSEFRPFDPNQGNYTLEGFVSARLDANTEVAAIFHHVSRHLSDRPKSFAVAYNEIGGRFMRRVTFDGTTIDVDLEGGRAVQHSYVDYTWLGEGHLLIRHPLTEHVGLFAHGQGQAFAVNEALDREVLTAVEQGDKAKLIAIPHNLLQEGTSEIKNWIPLAAVMKATGLMPSRIDYVPCYRSEAGTGNAMAFTYWQ